MLTNVRAKFATLDTLLLLTLVLIVALFPAPETMPLLVAGPMIKARNTMVASGQAFPLSGSQYEYLPFNALCEFAVLADTGASVRGTVYSGSDLLLQSSLVDILAVASPILYPDHYSLNDIAGAGERLSVELLEVAAGTPVVRTQVRITQV